MCAAQVFALVSLVVAQSQEEKTLDEILVLLKVHFSLRPSEILRFQFHR